MSRNRNLQYELDDYYDDEYYDDDDYYDEYYDENYEYEEEQQHLQENGSKAEETKTSSTFENHGNNNDMNMQINFIIDALSQIQMNSMVSISEARIQEALHKNNGDVLKVISQFEAEMTYPLSSMEPVKTPMKSTRKKMGETTPVPTPNKSANRSNSHSKLKVDANATPISSSKKRVTPLSPDTPMAKSVWADTNKIASNNNNNNRYNSNSKNSNNISVAAAASKEAASFPAGRRVRALSLDDYTNPIPFPIAPSSPSSASASSSGTGTSTGNSPIITTPIIKPDSGKYDGSWLSDDKNIAHLTIIVAGHVDAGKSTLVANLLKEAGLSSGDKIKNMKKLADENGRSSSYLAWMMDEDESEREHGITIGIAEKNFSTYRRNYTILDAPGHKDFVPNMISGASYADIALLVVSAAPGEFEASLAPKAQTREHGILLKALGVSKVVVVVNKMDITSPMSWSQARYDQVCYDVTAFLNSIMFNTEDIYFIPVSGMQGNNVVPFQASQSQQSHPSSKPLTMAQKLAQKKIQEATSTSERSREQMEQLESDISDMGTTSIASTWDTHSSNHSNHSIKNPDIEWWNGPDKPSLLELLDGLDDPPRDVEKPVRAVVTAALSASLISSGFSDGSDKTFEVTLKVLQGRVRKGRGLGMAPTAAVADVVRLLRSDGLEVDTLYPGECGTVILQDRGGRPSEEINIWEGMIFYKGPPGVRPVTRFKASILTTQGMQIPMLHGSTYQLYLHGEEVDCWIRKLYSSRQQQVKGQKDMNLEEKKRPKRILAGYTAKVQIQVARPVIIEPFSESKALGRFALRSKGETCAVGICSAIRVKDT